MKCSLQQLSALILLQGVRIAQGHYGFPVVVANDVVSEWFQYVRPVDPALFGDIIWVDQADSEAQICGPNATNTGHQTGTLKLAAGSSIGFKVAIAGRENPHPLNRSAGDEIYHGGPGQAYMSKAPGALEDYKGDGDWFKIGSIVAPDGQYWDSLMKTEMNFTIPRTTPPGKYLIRVEHMNINPQYNQTQQFINCAQVEVAGEGGGLPGPMTKFPSYKVDDPAIWLPTSMYMPSKPSELLKKYKGPGPAVWTG